LLISCSDNSAKEQLSTLQKIQSERVLNVGYVVYEPTVIKDPNTGELSGHFVDAIRFIADVMNVELVFHEADFSTFAAGLQSGRFDISIAATYRTIPRAMAVSFTNPIIYIGNGAIVSKDDVRFKTLNDFNQPNLKIAVAQGEASHEYAKEHFSLAKINALSTSDLSLPLAEVSVGRADIGLADAWSTAKYAKEHPEVINLFAANPYDLTPVGWAVRSEDIQLLNFINTAIEYTQSTGRMKEWEKIYDAHWVKPILTFGVE